MTSTVPCAESSSNSTIGNKSKLVRRLSNQISRLEKDRVGLHAMAAVVKKKSELATAVEQHVLDRLCAATESLSCKHSSPPSSLYSFSTETF
jgi:chorismate mutase